MTTNSHGARDVGVDHTPEVEAPDERPETVAHMNHGWLAIHEDRNPGGWIAMKERKVYR